MKTDVPGRKKLFWLVLAGTLLAAMLGLGIPSSTPAQTAEELRQKVQELERELAETRTELKQKEQEEEEARTELEEVQKRIEELHAGMEGIKIGPLDIGGAMRVNYVYGDYSNSDDGEGPYRGGHGGNVELDTFRINLDFDYGQWVGKAEYRWYDGYNFLHTGWLGYDFQDDSQVQVGVNRVPFGPGPFGISQSWFFDQHFYVGLADDMDLGVKYTKPFGNLTLDLAYYLMDEGHWRGDSEDSARYSYDVVDPTDKGYEERHQFNLRAIYTFKDWAVPTDLGVSGQYGLLESNGPQDDGDHYAFSGHMVNTFNNFTLASQLTYYQYDIDPHLVQSGVVTDDLIDIGAYDFPWPVAAEAYIAGTSLSYYLETPGIPWLEYVIPYVEYSTILKEKREFNDSELFVVGAGWGRGGWYIYTELAYSNGNYSVGDEAFTDFGANPDDEWQKRFNINLGYYF